MMTREDRPEINIKETIIRDWPILLVILGTFILGVVLFPSLPQRIPMHWNIYGQANRYAAKSVGSVFLLPLISLGMYVLYLAMPYIDPKKRNYASFMGSYRIIKMATFVFLGGLYVVTMLISLGYQIHINLMIRLGIGLLFLVMGNSMTRVRHNYFVGFRNPWTLANEEVWRRTHRFGGYIMVAAGLVIALSTFITGRAGAIVVLVAIAALVVITTLYSYLIYSKISKS